MNNFKPILITGPVGSGKSHLALAISMTHDIERVVRLECNSQAYRVSTLKYCNEKADLVIIDECHKNAIIVIHQQFLFAKVKFKYIFLLNGEYPESFKEWFFIVETQIKSQQNPDFEFPNKAQSVLISKEEE